MLGLLLTVTDVLSTYADDVITSQSFYIFPASFPVVLGDFGCDLTCQASWVRGWYICCASSVDGILFNGTLVIIDAIGQYNIASYS